jgi:hypothetical protein
MGTKREVNNVCFPSGAVVFNDTLYIYYGAADERILCFGLFSGLINELLLINYTMINKIRSNRNNSYSGQNGKFSVWIKFQ